MTFEIWDRWDIWSKLWLEVSLVAIAFQSLTLLRLILLIGHSFAGDFLRGLQERHMGGVQLGGGEPRHPLATIHLRRELFVKLKMLMWRLTFVRRTSSSSLSPWATSRWSMSIRAWPSLPFSTRTRLHWNTSTIRVLNCSPCQIYLSGQTRRYGSY